MKVTEAMTILDEATVAYECVRDKYKKEFSDRNLDPYGYIRLDSQESRTVGNCLALFVKILTTMLDQTELNTDMSGVFREDQ
ncbi:MAG: hypothetical protein IJE78_05910 [Bacteroidaceae bacterium]|nr:hypothetical protein [Bacteroidaceae bacterium]